MEEIQTEHGIFTNNEITGQTAQQVYDEWLLNKDKPLIPQLTTEEKITAMAEELVLVQTKLEASQEALDYIIMGGM